MKCDHHEAVSLPKFIASILTWASWLYSNNITGSSIVGLAYFLKCYKNCKNTVSLDHSDGFAPPIVPTGQPSNILCGLKNYEDWWNMVSNCVNNNNGSDILASLATTHLSQPFYSFRSNCFRWNRFRRSSNFFYGLKLLTRKNFLVVLGKKRH